MISCRQTACLVIAGFVAAMLLNTGVLIYTYDDFDEEYTKFLGEKWWAKEQLELCDNVTKDTRWRRNDSICVTYLHNLLPVDMEIVSWSPALVIYRNLLSPRQTTDFLTYIEEGNLVTQKTSDDGKNRETTGRRANGSFFKHEAANITAEVHRELRFRIPAVNFTNAEHFSALSYNPGGHYAIHSDYLDYSSEQQWDGWMKTMRNRMATLIFVLKPAETGGGTVFPKIGTTLRLNPGDAFFWFSMQPDEQKEVLTNHGGCPIYEGRKVIATLWVRAKYQSILAVAPTGAPIRADWLIPAMKEPIRKEIKSQCSVPATTES